MQFQPRVGDVVRAVIATDYSPVEGTIAILREKYAGTEAAVAVAFDDQSGLQRRGVVGLRRDRDETWRPGGGFMGSVGPPGDRDVWMTSGGWGGDSRSIAVLGGWVALPEAVAARATDPMTGRTLEEEVVHGVALFMYSGEFGTRYARLDLLDADGGVLRSGPVKGRA